MLFADNEEFEEFIFERILENGKVIERGSHDTLIASKGYYFDMYQKQNVVQL
jgi:ABC-type bacteriocin/lantibiotic exporter with double-glycine peptidase domain